MLWIIIIIALVVVGGVTAMAVARRNARPRLPSKEAQALMERTGTDPAFARLCRAQKSFRARLTPKPWRCECPKPPGEYPRAEPDEQREFANWCKQYAHAIEDHATCRFLETVGAGKAAPALQPLVELHDEVTRCTEDLPLA